MSRMILMRRRQVAVAIIVLLAIGSAACASVPIKQKATLSLQAAHTAVADAQDIEAAMWAAKADSLTPARHEAFGKFFERYFTADGKVAVALLAWRAGDPAPADLREALATLHEALTVAEGLTDGNDKFRLIGQINHGIEAAQQVLDAIVGGGQ